MRNLRGFMSTIGLDLNKSADILHAAYDDASGITAKFNKNILHRINSELGADFDLEQFEHHVVYDEKQMRTRCLKSFNDRQAIPKSGIRTVFEKDDDTHRNFSKIQSLPARAFHANRLLSKSGTCICTYIWSRH